MPSPARKVAFPGPLWISASLLNGPPPKNKVYFTLLYFNAFRLTYIDVKTVVTRGKLDVSGASANAMLRHTALILKVGK